MKGKVKMIFIHSGNEYSAILRNGDVIKFEDEREAQAVRAMYEDVQAVFGKMRNSECEIRNLEGGTPKKKKVRITIDPDVEFVSMKKALA